MKLGTTVEVGTDRHIFKKQVHQYKQVQVKVGTNRHVSENVSTPVKVGTNRYILQVGTSKSRYK